MSPEAFTESHRGLRERTSSGWSWSSAKIYYNVSNAFQTPNTINDCQLSSTLPLFYLSLFPPFFLSPRESAMETPKGLCPLGSQLEN
ncbi:hypothetical protein NQZ68_028224 [Dissostichus eleginoides]|nr:hypothetical protein NQZ68_028224 [Dissostichus eleginoides]